MKPGFDHLELHSFEQMKTLIRSSAAAAQPEKSRSRGYLLLALGIVLCTVLFAAIVYFFVIHNLNLGLFINKIIGIVVLGIPVFLLIMPGLKLIKAAGEAKIREQNYVLYLRSFRTDEQVDHWRYGLTRSPEKIIEAAFRPLGPLVGLGALGKEAAFGGYRIFVNDENWRDIVFNLVHYARMTVFYFSDREEIWWELALCRQYADPERLVIYMDESPAEQIAKLNASGLFGGAIRFNGDKQCFIAFDNTWQAFDPLLDRLKGKPFTIGLRNFVLQRRFGLGTAQHSTDAGFRWLRKAFSRQLLPICSVFLTVMLSALEMDLDWLWLGVLAMNVLYMYVFYSWIFVSLKQYEYLSFSGSGETERQQLKKEYAFVFAGFVLQALPALFWLKLLLEIAVLSADLEWMEGAARFIGSLIGNATMAWFWLMMCYQVLFVLILWPANIRKQKKTAALEERFVNDR